MGWEEYLPANLRVVVMLNSILGNEARPKECWRNDARDELHTQTRAPIRFFKSGDVAGI